MNDASGAIDVSLLLCTRDRAERLGDALDSIVRAAAAAPAVSIEVIVVDNGSADDTADRLATWRSRQPFPVVVLAEPRPGLARARNRALGVARGRIVAMTDDDCVLRADYLRGLVACFAEQDGAAIVGGRILLGDPADLLVTVKLEDHPMVAPPDAYPGGFVMGANLAFTADVVARVGAFDERFGAGARFVSAEDTDFLFRALALGIRVGYDPRFAVDHHHGRRHVADMVRLLAGYGYGDGAVYAKHGLGDRRVRAAIVQDLRDVVRDFHDAVPPFAGIRRFHLFRLRHKVAGFLAYRRRPGRDGCADGVSAARLPAL